MKSIKRFAKRSLSIILCLAMVMTTMIFFDWGLLKPEAAVVEKGRVAFYVPEVIYLYPNALEWKQSTATPFQYYIENTVNTSSIYSQPTTNTKRNTTGTIYFAAEDGFSNVTISTKFLKSDMTDLSGGSVSVGSFSNKTSYGTFSVTGGKSPSLDAGVQGCYLQWTVNYTNNIGETKSVIAYSYIYKPYTTPYGGAVWEKNTKDDDNEASQITWVSGVHSIAEAPRDYGNDQIQVYPRFNTGNSMAAFLSHDYTGYTTADSTSANVGTLSNDVPSLPMSGDLTSNHNDAKTMFAVFANEANNGYFRDVTDENSDDCWAWVTTDKSAGYPTKSFLHWYNTLGSQVNASFMVQVDSIGSIYIDTSRYSNLKDIPNLGVGLMVCRNPNSSAGSWYVADVTGTASDLRLPEVKGDLDWNCCHSGADWRSYYYENDKNKDGTISGIVFAKAGGEADGNMKGGDLYQWEGRKYSGVWVRPLNAKEGTNYYAVKGYYGNRDSDKTHANVHIVLHLDAIQSDKSALRTAVYEAIKEFGTLGVKENFGSCYYDTDNTAWTNFVNAYKKACRELTKLDGAPTSGTAEALDNAIAALKAGQGRRYYFDVNHDGINPNLYVYKATEVTRSGVTQTVNSAKETITLNGTLSNDAYFSYSPFSPDYGASYKFTFDKLSGTVTGTDGRIVLEGYSADKKQLNHYFNPDEPNGNDRRKLDWLPALSSDAPQTNSGTVTFDNAANGKSTASATNYVHLWNWRNSANAVYSDFTVRIKIEKGNTTTAYSPAGRVSSAGAYNTLPADPTREGYIFAGWYTNEDCSGSRVTTETAVTSDMLYAKWVANSEVMFGNEFNFEEKFKNPASGVTVDYIANSITMTVNRDNTQKNQEKQTGFVDPLELIQGHSYRITFDFAAKDNSNGTTEKASGQVHICFTSDGTKEQLEESKLEDNYNNYNFYVDAKGAVIPEGSSVAVNGQFTVPTGKKYVHLCFDVNLEEGDKVTGTISNIYVYDITNSLNNWDDLSEPKDSNGNKTIFVTGEPGDAITSFPTPSRSGYNFAGWSTKRNETTGVADPLGKVTGSYTLSAGVTTLYSLWEPKTYTVKFDSNGGEGSMSDLTMKYDGSLNLPENSFKRENCIFKGWSVQQDSKFGGIFQPGESVGMQQSLYPDENDVITFYAQWDIEGEIIFGNEFDFDKYAWLSFSKSTATVDYSLNTVTLISGKDEDDGESNGKLDAYTNNYNNNQSGYMTLIPGRTYEFSCTAENLSAKKANASLYLFSFTTEGLTDEITGDGYKKNFISVEVDINANSSGEVKGSFKIPEGRSFATIRVGTHTPDVTMKFSDICVRDITNFATVPEAESPVTITKAKPQNYAPGTTVNDTSFPKLERQGYTFKGWSTTKNMTTGNGEDVVKLVTMPDTQNVKTNNVKLYPVWIPNFIIVRMNLYSSTVDQKFFFDEEQALTKVTETPETDVLFYDGEEELDRLSVGMKFVYWSEIVEGSKLYDDAQLVTNPGGADRYKTASEKIYDLYAVWDVADNVTITAPFYPKKTNDANNYVLKGWTETKGSLEVEYEVGDEIKPEKGSKFYAVWHEIPSTDTKIEKFEERYKGEDAVVTVVSGIEIGADGVANAAEIKESSDKFNTSEFDTAKLEYDAKKIAYESNKNAETNNALLGAIGNVESSAAKVPAEEAVIDYLGKFEIKYAEGVEGAVPAGKYSVADMNLNHYTKEELDKVSTEWGTARTYTTETNQVTINESVVKLAKAFANPQKVESTPTYNVYDADTSLPADLAARVDESKGETAGVSYVYTGKGNYTYYCYTNSKNPKLFIAVNEATSGNARVCYPTNAIVEKAVTTQSATANADVIQVTVDNPADYSSYFTKGMGTTRGEDYYNKKDVVVLSPQFGVNDDKATVTYTFKAYDDAYAPLIDGKDLSGKDAKVPDPDYLNYADSAVLASGAGSGNLSTGINRPDLNVTPENTITIIIDYHPGDTMNVTADQVGHDQWLKQYHLFRTSGGASNWELPMPNDSVYTVDDNTYGQEGYGSFTYTFNVGTEDISNSVFGSADLEYVKDIVKKHHSTLKTHAFKGTHVGGTGLGYIAWPNTTWSFNYYPQSQAYTYVHIVDRWGNTVDKVIQVPNLDGNATKVTAQTAGSVNVLELGGSGIDTMSFSAQSFEIITDENSIFDGEIYTTSGNTIKVYTGEANKKYTLAANDVATNKTTANVTTDAEGYLTITVEDEAFDTRSGAYTFTLNGMEINLYAEVEKNVISATGDSVEKGTEAMIEVVTTDKVTSVQLVSETGSTTTLSEYAEDEDGNRVWTVGKNKDIGEYTYTVRIKTADGWTTEGNKVTVTVTEPTFFVGAVTNVEYTPSTSTRNEFMFTVTGRPDKIQVIEPDGGTRTYDRYHVNVIIVSYDENGNIVGAMSRELSYEVWTIEMNVPADIELTAIARYGREWSKDAPYKYTVILATPEFDDEVYSMSLAATEGKQGRVAATVVTGLDVQGVRFAMDNNTTTTYYNSSEADGKLTYNGYAWMNHEGKNIIIVKIRVNNAWLNVGELNYNAI